VYDIATVEIPKYSDYNNLYRYAKKIFAYVDSHELKLRTFIDRETTAMYLSHLDDKRYAKTVKECEMALRRSTIVDNIYKIPEIAETIDQMCPTTGLSTPHPAPSSQRPHNSHIRQLTDYCENDAISPDHFDEHVDNNEDLPWIRSFRRGGGRTPFRRGGSRRGHSYQNNHQYGRGNSVSNSKLFKGTCNCCRITGHHTDSCHFLLKPRQAFSYLKMDPRAPYKKRYNFKGKNSYQKNNSYVCSLQDAGFIPFDGADADNFIDVVDDNHAVFTPDINNSTEAAEDILEWQQEEETSTTAPLTSPAILHVVTGKSRDINAVWEDKPYIRCLQDILNDEHTEKYSHISDINISIAVSMQGSNIPSTIRIVNVILPKPEPPPDTPIILVTDVIELECKQGATSPPQMPFTTNSSYPKPFNPPDISHLLCDTFMILTEELQERFITPATILKFLALHDKNHFTTNITSATAHHFWLNVDGGANWSVTNNLDYLHTSWDISPYTIGSIGAGITCTKKSLFHLICDNGYVLSVSMFYAAEATETVLSPTDIFFFNADQYNSWRQIANCTKCTGELRFYKTNEITRASILIIMHNKLWYIDQDLVSTIYRSRINTTVLIR